MEIFFSKQILKCLFVLFLYVDSRTSVDLCVKHQVFTSITQQTSEILQNCCTEMQVNWY